MQILIKKKTRLSIIQNRFQNKHCNRDQEEYFIIIKVSVPS